MIRIRGPVGTLRVLMLPGESDPSWDVTAGAAPFSNTVPETESTREADRDQ